MEWDDEPDGATPLPEDLRDGLKPSWISTMGDLNEAEADGILAASAKWHGRTNSLDTLLDDKTVRDLHRDMFGDVWAWAGGYRNREVNIGIDPHQVPVAVRNLVEDAKYWFADGSTMDVDHAGVQFHHRLVAIHPFPNGNGRHARLLTDLVLSAAGVPQFSWGSNALGPAGEVRKSYISALRTADLGDCTDLVRFVRT
jgi:Fic-DOC domain mobile mystery protein B